MWTFIYVFMLWAFFPLLIAAEPFQISLRFRNKGSNPTTCMTREASKTIEQKVFSELVFVSKTAVPGGETVCIAIGALVTITKRLLSQRYVDCFVNYYIFSEHFIRLIRSIYMGLLIIPIGNFLYYDEMSKKVMRIETREISSICGPDFGRNLRSYPRTSITFGFPFKTDNEIKLYNGSKLVFIPKYDNLSTLKLIPSDISYTIKRLIQLDIPDDNQIIHKYALSANRGAQSLKQARPSGLDVFSIDSDEFRLDDIRIHGYPTRPFQPYPSKDNNNDDVSTELRLGPQGS